MYACTLKEERSREVVAEVAKKRLLLLNKKASELYVAKI